MSMTDAGEKSTDGTARLQTGECTIEGRQFVITLLLFTNGCFVSISEDSKHRLGAITLSVKSAGRAISSSLIPESKGSMLANMIGEMLAEALRGMAIISLYLRSEVGAADMKTLISEVRKMLEKVDALV